MAEIVLSNFAEKALKRITPIYDESTFMKSLFNGVGVAFDPIRQLFKTFNKQGFIDSVTWAIACEELKYGLDVRPDLTLEERRARLGIRAALHRPLNPARLERAIFEHFGVKTYLDEKIGGYIRVYFNRATQNGFLGMVNFLKEEKPAHLELRTFYHIIDYTGGEEDSHDDEIIGPDDEPDVPKNPDEKKLFPRIFYGIGAGIGGKVDLKLAQPTNEIARASAGIAQLLGGNVTITPSRMENSKVEVHAGVCMNIGGEVLIDSVDEPLPPLKIKENPTPQLAVAGGFKPKSTHILRKKLLRAVSEEKISQTFGAIARGSINFTPPPIDEFEQLSGDCVKIFFDFNISRHRRHRGVAMNNARPDLTRAEIKAVGELAVREKIIMNEAGEIASGVSHAALKYKDKIQIF